MVTSISFVRHGHVYNPQLLYYGRLPGFPLSEDGIRQAQSVAKVFCGKPVQAVFSSPLLRTRQAAEIIIAPHDHLQLKTSQLLTEAHTPFDGHPRSEIADRDWDVYTGNSPEYEQPQDVFQRVKKFVEKVRRNHTGESIIAVTHGDLIAFMILWANSVPIASRNRDRLNTLVSLQDNYPAPASISIFTYQTNSGDEVPKVEYLKP